VRTFTAALVTAVVAVGCVAGGPSVDELREHPEAELLVPGSTVVAQREWEAAILIDGRQWPTITTVAGSEESEAKVRAFYDTELPERGWQTPSDRAALGLQVPTTSDLTVTAWRKGDFVFRLAIADMTHPDNGDRADEFETLYRVSLVHRPAQDESQ
jgi:hypothetical protein